MLSLSVTPSNVKVQRPDVPCSFLREEVSVSGSVCLAEVLDANRADHERMRRRSQTQYVAEIHP
jgi:hypothetical protein